MKTLARLDHPLVRGRVVSRTASVLAGMGVHFPEGTGRFLSVVIRKLYLAGLLRL